MINVEMFKRIEEIIIAHPERHRQAYFEAGDSMCGTTRCVAGWAIHFWGLDNGINGSLHEIEEAYIGKIESSVLTENYEFAAGVDAEHVGAHILGLNPDQGHDLFFNMSNDDALRMVKEYAQGSTDVRCTEEEGAY